MLHSWASGGQDSEKSGQSNMKNQAYTLRAGGTIFPLPPPLQQVSWGTGLVLEETLA